MKKKKPYIIGIIATFIAVLLIGGVYYLYPYFVDTPFLQVSEVYDTEGNLLHAFVPEQAIVGGIEGVKYIKLKINIDKKITEQKLIEHCLNLKHSGYDPTILMAFYFLGTQSPNAFYYFKLVNQVK